MSAKHSILLTQLSMNSDKKKEKKKGKRLKHFAKLEPFNLCTHPRTLADTEPGHYGDKEAALRAEKKDDVLTNSKSVRGSIFNQFHTGTNGVTGQSRDPSRWADSFFSGVGRGSQAADCEEKRRDGNREGRRQRRRERKKWKGGSARDGD